jgi:hypothetical protein
MRRFNYTGRKRIFKKDVAIQIMEKSDTGLPFEAIIDLPKYDLPEDAPVYLEAYHQTKLERFDFGTVKETIPQKETVLKTFDEDENINFTVKVVDLTEKNGRLLALVKGLKPSSKEPAKHKSLLPVSIQPLDNLVYELQFSDDAPVLILNERFSENGINFMPLDEYFTSLCFPPILKEILTRIIVIDDITDPDEDNPDWQTKWLKYAKQFNNESIPSEEDDSDGKLQWIDDVVDGWAYQTEVINKFEVFMEGK